MSGEFEPQREKRVMQHEFVDHALGILGVESVQDLGPRDMARIAMAFHSDRCDREVGNWIPDLELTAEEMQKVWSFGVARSAEMRSLLEVLIGYDGDYSFDDDALRP